MKKQIIALLSLSFCFAFSSIKAQSTLPQPELLCFSGRVNINILNQGEVLPNVKINQLAHIPVNPPVDSDSLKQFKAECHTTHAGNIVQIPIKLASDNKSYVYVTACYFKNQWNDNCNTSPQGFRLG